MSNQYSHKLNFNVVKNYFFNQKCIFYHTFLLTLKNFYHSSNCFPFFLAISTEPLIGHGKIKIVPCIKSCAQDDLVITRK